MASITDARTSTSPAPEARPAAVSSDAQGPKSDFQPAPPSETVEPTTVTTPPQQGKTQGFLCFRPSLTTEIAATQPDSGGHVTQTIIMQPARRASFSQRVVGYAKVCVHILPRWPFANMSVTCDSRKFEARYVFMPGCRTI